jgi:hypothetical protein
MVRFFVDYRLCYGSGIFLSSIPDPDIYLSRLPDLGPDPTTTTKEKGKISVCLAFLLEPQISQN